MSVPTVEALVATDESWYLAEGPVWVDGALHWVDAAAGRLVWGELTDDDRVAVLGTRDIGFPVGIAVPGTDGATVLSASGGFWRMEASGRLTEGPQPAAGAGLRMNDGACDPCGRFVAGSAHASRRLLGGLFRLDGDGCTELDGGIGLSNGIAWSPDGTTMYHADSARSLVRSFPYDVETGAVGEPELLVDLSGGPGLPDGVCTDVDGAVWVAVFGAGEVRRFDRDGRLIGIVATPGSPQTTSVCFAGADLTTLVITTAREEMDEATRAAAPNAGRLFVAPAPVAGVGCARWDGQWPADDSSGGDS